MLSYLLGLLLLITLRNARAYATPSTIALRTTTHLPQKRANDEALIGSRVSNGRSTTSSCRGVSTFAISGIYAGCITSGQRLATRCAANHRSENSMIVDGALWCTDWCFSSNKIYTTNAANPLIMPNCFGDYSLQRYADTEAKTTVGTSETTGLGGITSSLSDVTSARLLTTTSTSTSADVAHNTETSTPGSNSNGNGLSGGAIAGIVVGVVSACVGAVGTWVRWKIYKNKKKDREYEMVRY